MEITTMKYPPLPLPPSAEQGEPTHHYGMRLLRFVVDTNITATMSDEELALAGYMVPVAMWHKGRDGTDLLVVEAVRKAATLINQAVTLRQKVDADIVMTTPPVMRDNRDGGDREPLHPHTPTLSPAGTYADYVGVDKPGDRIRF